MDIIHELLLSWIISIPKGMKSSLHDSNYYRGISLFNAICKVYAHAITFLCYNKFINSDMQFGFKANHSTVMCSLVYHEIINHYLKHCSNVYSCSLDASKAFDKVHNGKLFRILLYKKVPFCIIRLLLDSYIRQQAKILCNTLF